MNLQFYLEKLFASEKFQSFVKENPSAYFCSGFFSIDKIENHSKQHFDYYVPSIKKIFSFQLENEIKLVSIEMIDDKVPEKILVDCDFDFEKVEKIILSEMIYKGIKNKLQKILLSLQNSDGKDVLVGTVFISGLGMLKIRISLPETKIIEFEKKSFFDMMKIVKK